VLGIIEKRGTHEGVPSVTVTPLQDLRVKSDEEIKCHNYNHTTVRHSLFERVEPLAIMM